MDSSDSDEDGCQLYSKSEENFLKKRGEIQAKRRELENVIDLMTENEVDIALNDENFTYPPLVTEKSTISKPNLDSSPIRIEDISDLDENVPLSELSRNLRRSKRRQQQPSPPPPPKRRPKRSSRRQNNRVSTTSEIQNQDVIVFDDDTGYTEVSLPPMDFNSRRRDKKSKSRFSDLSGNISMESVLNDDLNEDELIENDDIVTLTIEWNNGHKTTRKPFKLRRYQKFESVFEELAKMENISSNRVLLMYDFKSINPMDTPSSLNLKFYGALMGSVSNNEINRNKANFNNENGGNSESTGCIQVKLLLQSKKTLLLSVLNHQKMEVLYKKCAEELKCERSTLKLTFDGEYVEPSDLVSDLDIENGDVFHVHIKSS